MKAFVTSSEGFLAEQSVGTHPLRREEFDVLRVYPERRRQEIIGFGAALTEAAAVTFAQMDPQTQERFLQMCFSDEGNAYSFCRLAIGSCDFSPKSYDIVKMAGLGSSVFSIDHDRQAIIPFVKRAQEVRPDLQFFASPWSPPAFMKTSFRRSFGGHLRRGAYDGWAHAMVHFIEAYAEEGIEIGRVTVQNEPMARQTWESCLYTPDEEREFAVESLAPALAAAGLGHVKVLVWDHNKDKILDRVEATLAGEDALKAIGGIAFHWYTGDHFEQLAAVHEAFPEMELIFSEGCAAFSGDDADQQLSDAEKYAHEMIGDINAGTCACVDWNILLDSQGGPNHVRNYCDSPLMYDVASGELRRNPSFSFIGTISHFVKPGAYALLVSCPSPDIEATAFENPDGGHVAIVLNRTDWEQGYTLCDGESVAPFKQPAHTVVAFAW